MSHSLRPGRLLVHQPLAAGAWGCSGAGLCPSRRPRRSAAPKSPSGSRPTVCGAAKRRRGGRTLAPVPTTSRASPQKRSAHASCPQQARPRSANATCKKHRARGLTSWDGAAPGRRAAAAAPRAALTGPGLRRGPMASSPFVGCHWVADRAPPLSRMCLGVTTSLARAKPRTFPWRRPVTPSVLARADAHVPEPV